MCGLSEREMKRLYSDAGKVTKYAIATSLVARFPFLARSLPPPRKISESEDYRMGIFTAIALAVATVSGITTHRVVRFVQ
jgi:hypothetical protein